MLGINMMDFSAKGAPLCKKHKHFFQTGKCLRNTILLCAHGNMEVQVFRYGLVCPEHVVAKRLSIS